jgi:hypothetical protein
VRIPPGRGVRRAHLIGCCLFVWIVGGIAHAATYTVTSAANSGTGTLRWAINRANDHSGPDTIRFDPALMRAVIRPRTLLPYIRDDGTTIDGDIDGDGDPDVVINGRRIADPDTGLWVYAADNCVIAGLVIAEFDTGIFLYPSSGTLVRSCHLGTNLAGTAPRPCGMGVELNYADGNRVGDGTWRGRNVIAASGTGIYLYGSDDNVIAGNHIGVTRDGSAAIGEGSMGVYMDDRPEDPDVANVIGGTRTGERNVFGGLQIGVQIKDVQYTQICGNYFGLGADGETALPIALWGVELHHSRDTLIGGSTARARNVFAGGADYGVEIHGSEARGNVVRGNYFGLNAAGTRTRRLCGGVHVRYYAGPQTIGGRRADQGNYFCAAAPSGTKRGVFFEEAGGGSTVRNNTFGLYPDGRKAQLLNVGVKIGEVSVNVTDNTIAQCLNGIEVNGAGANPIVLRNNLRNCGAAVAIAEGANCRLGNVRSSLGEGRNRFRGSNVMHIINGTPNRIVAEGNRFHSTVEAEIHVRIYDYRDDHASGRVDISPLMGGVIPTGGVLAVTALSAAETPGGAGVYFTLSGPAQVGATVRNIAGRPVRTLCRAQDCEAGTNALLWDATSDTGLRVPSGTYVVELTASAPDGSQARALTQVRVRR